MHPRFAGAGRVTISCDDVELEVVVADTFALRLKGLAGIDALDLEPLLFPRCRSLHTFWMRSPIDVVWLDLELKNGEGAAQVTGVEPMVSPRRTVVASRRLGREVRRRVAALELPPGCLGAMKIDDRLRLSYARRGSQSGESALACQSAQAR